MERAGFLILIFCNITPPALSPPLFFFFLMYDRLLTLVLIQLKL